MNVTGISTAGLTACSLGATAIAETALGDPIDPASRREVFIHGGGPIAGGSSAGFLHVLFPAPGAHPSVDAIRTVVERHKLLDALLGGAVLYDTRHVPGWEMPELLTLWAVPAPVLGLVRAMERVNSWNEWMPRFDISKGRYGGRLGTQYQEAKMTAAGLKIHYQILVEGAPLGDGHQIHWQLDETGFKKDSLLRGNLGLRVNNGSCTFAPALDRYLDTIVAYSIHTQVTPLVPGTASTILETTIREFPEFPASLTSRTLDPTWTRRRPHGSAMQPFTMRRAP